MKRNEKKRKILVVEDNPDQAALIDQALHICFPDVDSVKVNSRDQALAYLQKCTVCEWDLPNMVFLDLYLPKRENGWQTLKGIRNLPAPLCYLPIVLLTSSDQLDDVQEAYKRGVSCYIVKPTRFDDWLERFKALKSYWFETIAMPDLRLLF